MPCCAHVHAPSCTAATSLVATRCLLARAYNERENVRPPVVARLYSEDMNAVVLILVLLAACDGTSKAPAPVAPTAPVAPVVSSGSVTTTPAPPVIKRALSTNSFVVPGPVTLVAVASGGELVAAGSDRFAGTDLNHALVVWDRAGVERYRTVDVTDATFDSTASTLVIARLNEPIELIDTKTWRSRGTVPACPKQSFVDGIALSPDDKTLAITCPRGAIRLQPVGRGAAVVLQGTEHARSVKWSRDGVWLAISDGYSWVRIIETKTRAVRHRFKTISFHGMAFAPNANVLAFGDFDSVRFFDLTTNREKRGLKINAGALAYSPDGTQLAVAPLTGPVSVQVADLATGARHDLVGTAPKTFAKLAFDSAGRLWVGQDHAVRAFDVASKAVTIAPGGHRGAVTQLVFRGDGKVLASTGSDRTVRIWDVAAGTSKLLDVVTNDDGGILPRTGDDAAYKQYPMAAGTGLAWAANGNLISTDEYVLREWRRDTYELLKAKRLQHELGGVAVVADGSLLTLGLDENQVTLRWSDRDAKELRHVDLDLTQIYPRLRLAMSGDGKRVVVSGSQIRVLDATTGSVVHDVQDSDARGLALDWTGSLVGIAGDSVLQLQRIGTGPEPPLLPTSSRARAIAVTPDGKRAIVGGSLGEVVVIDLQAVEKTEEVLHHGAVRAIAIAPDGKSFATAGDDGAIMILPLD